jgi:hypothetical protein
MQRQNKSKEELLKEAEYRAIVTKKKELVKEIFPLLQKQKTLYDAQTVMGALAGFISQELKNKNDALILEDLNVDFKGLKEGPIRETVLAIYLSMNTEKAQMLSDLLNEMAEAFNKLGVHRFLNKEITEIKLDDLI